MDYYNLQDSLEIDTQNLENLEKNPRKPVQRAAESMFPVQSKKGYYRQLDETAYCMLLTLINAQIFYELPALDIHGKDKDAWIQLLIKTKIMKKIPMTKEKFGLTFQTPKTTVDQIAPLFDFFTFPLIPSLEKIKKIISLGMCLGMSSSIGREKYLHSYLVIDVIGDDLVCVNYDVTKQATEKKIPWKKITWVSGNEHLFLPGFPTMLGHCLAITPKMTPELMALANNYADDLLMARSYEMEGSTVLYLAEMLKNSSEEIEEIGLHAGLDILIPQFMNDSIKKFKKYLKHPPQSW